MVIREPSTSHFDIDVARVSVTVGVLSRAGGGGGGVALPIMDYTGRLYAKWVPFAGWSYIKGYGFH